MNKLFYQFIFILFFTHYTSITATSYIVNDSKKTIKFVAVTTQQESLIFSGVRFLPAEKSDVIPDKFLKRYKTLTILDPSSHVTKEIASAPLQDNTTYIYKNETLTYRDTETIPKNLITDEDRNRYLIKAVQRGFEEQVRALIGQGVNVNTTDKYGTNLLMFAILENQKDILDLLQNQQGIQINKQSKDGTTPLILATKRGKKDMVLLLLNKGADKTIKDNQGKTALDYAQEKNLSDIVKILKK